MILQAIGMLLVSSSRSKAYLQILLKHDIKPSHVLMIDHQRETLLPGQRISDVSQSQEIKDSSVPKKKSQDYFNPEEQLIETLTKHHISHEIIYSQDVNNPHVISALKNRREKYFIYSGFGGGILKSDILNIGKDFIHIHSGLIPSYRGSTTIYYSILNENKCTATAFFLNEHLDSGDIIKIKEFPKPKNGETIDFIYDAHIRSLLLLEVLQEYIKIGAFKRRAQSAQQGETYFIIHPVLKHLAILTCKK